MPHYTVTWSIDIWADSEEAAAVQALAVQRDPGSIATVFEVTDDAGRVTGVDLLDHLARGGNATGGNIGRCSAADRRDYPPGDTPTDRALDAVQALARDYRP